MTQRLETGPTDGARDACGPAGFSPAGGGCLLPVPAGVALRYPERAVVVVTGLPGAGKSSLLKRARLEGCRVLDPYDATGWLPPRLQRRAHRALRVPIHALHWGTAIVGVLTGRQGLVVHAHGARRALPSALLLAGRLRGRPAHLLVVLAAPAEALAGQAVRGRRVPARRFADHVRQSAALDTAIRRGGDELTRWDSVCVARRAAASAVEAISCRGEFPPPVDGPTADVSPTCRDVG